MQRSFGARVLRAALALAVVDGLWAVLLTWYFGRPPLSVWNGVASTAFGAGMLQAGGKGVAVGLAMHCTVATWWSLVWVTAESNLPVLQRWTAGTGGAFAVAAVYGPLIWMTMSGLVVPTMTGRWEVMAGNIQGGRRLGGSLLHVLVRRSRISPAARNTRFGSHAAATGFTTPPEPTAFMI